MYNKNGNNRDNNFWNDIDKNLNSIINEDKYYIKKYNGKDKNIIGFYIKAIEISNDELKLAVTKQLEKLKKYCEDNNIQKMNIYIDTTDNGNAFEQLKNDINNQEIQRIVCTSVSKLSRNLKEICNLMEVAESKDVEIVTLDSGIINSLTAYGWLAKEEYDY